jgi:hypothetical protein
MHVPMLLWPFVAAAFTRAPLFADKGDLEQFFERLLTQKSLRPHVISRSPWVVQLDAFSSETQCKALLGAAGTFYPSIAGAVAKRMANVRNSTSYSCPLHGSDCARRRGMAEHTDRVLGVLGVNKSRADAVHLLRYQSGGFYLKHTDYIGRKASQKHWDRCGPRVLTFMLYLSTPEDGGATRFHSLGTDGGYDVEPRRGRALVWSNAFPDEEISKDARTVHEALRVRQGVKEIATTWVHAFGARRSGRMGCYPDNPRASLQSIKGVTAKARDHVATPRAAVSAAAAQAIAPAPQTAPRAKQSGGYGWIPRLVPKARSAGQTAPQKVTWNCVKGCDAYTA